MAIAWESDVSTVANTAATSFAVNKPTGVVDNDVLVFIAGQGNADGPLTPPSGWTEVIEVSVGGGTMVLALAYKVITDAASEPASYTMTSADSQKWVGGIGRLSGVDTTTPIDVSGSDTGDSSTPTAPSITTTVADTLLIAASNIQGPRGPHSPPSGYDERWDVENSSGGGASAPATKTQASTGASGTAQFTADSGNDWGAILVAFAPAAAAGPVGTLAVTQDDQTSTASGDSKVTGSLSETQDDQTSVGSGESKVLGSLSDTQDNQTSTASGVVDQVTGTLSKTQADQTPVASGEVKVVGSLSETQTDQTSTASGVVWAIGSLSETQADQTSTASGVVDQVTGTLAETQEDQTVVSSGWVNVTGTLTETQGDQTVVSTGVVWVFGTLNRIQEDQTSVVVSTFTPSTVSGSDIPASLRRSARSRRTAIRGWRRPPSWR